MSAKPSRPTGNDRRREANPDRVTRYVSIEEYLILATCRDRLVRVADRTGLCLRNPITGECFVVTGDERLRSLSARAPAPA